MKKSMIAAACMCCASAAFGQSNVNIYGVMDLSISKVNGSTPGTGTPAFNGDDLKVNSGTLQGSRLGFKGSEDIGGGWSALFTLESGILADTGASDQGGLAFGRQAFVGIRHAQYGALTIGRQYGPEYLAWKTVEPMDDGFAGGASNLISTNGKRNNNTVKYTTPTVAGVTADILYGLGEVPGNSKAGRSVGGSVVYSAGPVLIKTGVHRLNNSTGTDRTTTWVFGGSYDFKVVKAIAIVGGLKGSGTAKASDLLLGASVPFGASTILASYIAKNDKSAADKDARQVALTYTYDLSKRTIFYISTAHVSNDNGANYHTFDATLPSASQTGAVGGTKEYNVGLRHAF